jgi:membrane-bound serine protease (ClpP class)
MGGVFLSLGAIILVGQKLRSLKSWSKSGIVLKTPPPPLVDRILINIGDIAVVVATLRPSGKVERDGMLFDAISEGQFLDVGTKVKVITIHGQQIIVEPS